MRTVGLITEYNPFHNGHKYHVEKAKEVTGADHVIAVMSGNFVQRGGPAFTDKYTRARMALLGGCDLIIELPVRYATSSAEGFALGAVGILSACGVDGICFGSECGDVETLDELGRMFHQEPWEYKERLANYLRVGDTFPLARRKAALDYGKEAFGLGADKRREWETVLSSPNDILGVEYCKAIIRLQSPIKPYAVLRRGAGYHDAEMVDGFASASGIRAKYKEMGELGLDDGVPDVCHQILKEAEGVRFPVWKNDFSDLLHYAILMNGDRLEQYVDVSEELADRIRRCIDSFTDWKGFATLLKTKPYTLTRIHRCLVHILLGLTKQNAVCEGVAPYLRILGFRSESSKLVKKIKTKMDSGVASESQVPVITKLSDGIKELEGKKREIIEEDILAAHLYNRILYKKYGTKSRNEYQCKMIVVP